MSLRTISLSIVAFIALGCGKNPNVPDANTSVSGHWISSDTVEVLTKFDVQMIQSQSGLITGSWIGKTRVVNGSCDSTLGCAPTNSVNGSNLSLRVELDILGAGSFAGQLAERNRIVGKMVRFGILYEMTLQRVD